MMDDPPSVATFNSSLTNGDDLKVPMCGRDLRESSSHSIRMVRRRHHKDNFIDRLPRVTYSAMEYISLRKQRYEVTYDVYISS